MAVSLVETQSNVLDNGSLSFVAFPSLPSMAFSLWSSDCVELSSAASICAATTSRDKVSPAAHDSLTICASSACMGPMASPPISSFPTRLAAHLQSTATSVHAYSANCASFRTSSISLSMLQCRRRHSDSMKVGSEKWDTIPSLASLVTSLPLLSSTEIKGGTNVPDQNVGDGSLLQNFMAGNAKFRKRLVITIQHLNSKFLGIQKQSEVAHWKDNSELEVPSGSGNDRKTSKFGEGGRQAVQTSKHLMAGAVAAMVSRTIVAPLERLKLEYLLRGAKGHVLDVMGGILHSEGLGGFWKGNGVNLLRTAPFKAINFYAYDAYRSRLLKLGNRNEVSNFERLAAGAVSGVTATILCFPMDTLRTMIVAPGGEALGGLKGCCKHLIRTEGVLGLYKGLLPAIVSMAPAGAVFYGVYDILKTSYLNSPEGKAMIRARQRRAAENPGEACSELELGTVRTLLYGALAGACSETVTYPLEVVRRAQQMHTAVNRQNMLGTIQALLAKGGIGAFYAGIIPSTMQVLPSAALSYFVYESVKIAFKIT